MGNLTYEGMVGMKSTASPMQLNPEQVIKPGAMLVEAPREPAARLHELQKMLEELAEFAGRVSSETETVVSCIMGCEPADSQNAKAPEPSCFHNGIALHAETIRVCFERIRYQINRL